MRADRTAPAPWRRRLSTWRQSRGPQIPPTPLPSVGGFWMALAEALVLPGTEPLDVRWHDHALKAASTFLEAQVPALPLLMWMGVHVGLLAFRGHVRISAHVAFARLSPQRRLAAVDRWASGRLPQGRYLFRALRNLALLAYYEDVCRASVTIDQPDDRERAEASAVLARLAPTAMPVWDRALRHQHAGVLVIGSGAGGAVTALELADAGHDVLLVEEGDVPGPAAMDAGSIDTMARCYRSRGMTPIMGRVPIAYVEGRCVGGSTEINSGFWHRPPTETLLRWKARYELDAASPDELRPHWEWAERLLDVGRREGGLPPSSTVFADGARAMDWSVSEIPRTASHARDGASGSGRQPGPGMSRSLIPRALTAGARLATGCRVVRLERRGDRVVGAHIERRRPDGSLEMLQVHADHVFVCAGATETPALLRRSGIVHGIGNSLRIHPMLKVAARFPNATGAAPGAIPLLQVREFWPELVLGGAFFSSGHLAAVLANNWSQVADRMRYADNMATYYVAVRGTGQGSVRPLRLDPSRTVVRYELSNEDMWNLSRGLARLSTLLLEGGAVEVLPAVQGVPTITSEVEAIRWLDDRLDGRACSLTSVHAFSSCPIGERRERCAADSFGKVYGLSNLYVNDASMVPDSPGVNPQGTIMTLARRNALHFRDVHRA